jgi:hypothetical protein
MDLLVEAELKTALAAEGCPICRVGEEAASRYIRFTLHEGVNDPATRGRLASTWGFCRHHAWHFLRLEWGAMQGGLGTATITEALLETAEQLLGDDLGVQIVGVSRRRRRVSVEKLVRSPTPSGACPACDVQARHEGYALTVALAVLEDEPWQQRFRDSDGLCLSHLREALTRGDAPNRVRWIVEDRRRRLRGLLADPEEYIRKHDYRFSHEPYGPERDAFVRAVAALAGSWFDLPGRSPDHARKEAEQSRAQEGGHHG